MGHTRAGQCIGHTKTKEDFSVEELLDTLLVNEEITELSNSDDLWWVIASSNWVLAGPQ